jgi:hypothetical protein
MFNVNSTSDDLKETFREDFHQVLAYSSFSGSQQKTVMIFYPYNPPEGSNNQLISRKLVVQSSMNGYTCKAYLVGISLKIADLESITQKLSSDIIKI